MTATQRESGTGMGKLEDMANTFENCNTIKQRVVGSNPSRDAFEAKMTAISLRRAKKCHARQATYIMCSRGSRAWLRQAACTKKQSEATLPTLPYLL